MTQTLYTPSWMLSLIRKSFQDQPGSPGFKMIMERLWDEMEKANVPGVIRTDRVNQPFHAYRFLYNQAPYELKASATEAYSYLIRNGYAVEQVSENFPEQQHAEALRWTDRGLGWIAGAEPIPENAEGYLSFLRSRLPQLDAVIQQYIVEALSAFEREAYFAAAVMAGAAAEKALYLLAESLLVAMNGQTERDKLTAVFNKRRLFDLFEIVRNKISFALKAKTLPYEIAEGATIHLMSIFEAIRVQRNDAVHPLNASVSPQGVRLLLVSLPYALQSMCTLQDWFYSHPASI